MKLFQLRVHHNYVNMVAKRAAHPSTQIVPHTGGRRFLALSIIASLCSIKFETTWTSIYLYVGCVSVIAISSIGHVGTLKTATVRNAWDLKIEKPFSSHEFGNVRFSYSMKIKVTCKYLPGQEKSEEASIFLQRYHTILPSTTTEYCRNFGHRIKSEDYGSNYRYRQKQHLFPLSYFFPSVTRSRNVWSRKASLLIISTGCKTWLHISFMLTASN